MNTTELLNQWLVGIRIAHIQQFLASNHSEKMHRRLGIPTVVLSTVVGTSVFASLDANPEIWLKIVIGLLSVASAVLAALQTFMGYAEKSSEYKAAAIRYGKLRRELEQYISTRSATCTTDEAFMLDYRNRWDDTDSTAPTTAQSFHVAAREQVAAARSRQADKA
ncbi:MAG: DUF4231 domain-containing protein [Aquabacterium sp.]|uniref:DUF4231 domain-containing protein n=1 Tax=Aquabacterium sp. TaxID=1872578 RepID=UPI00120EB6BB|nr:DUF4231 domain-containing protein [Aquabacterium sp.]TAK96952.1 MAG: DUF4231 domain-containing protein [Aquabacterium sp.]